MINPYRKLGIDQMTEKDTQSHGWETVSLHFAQMTEKNTQCVFVVTPSKALFLFILVVMMFGCSTPVKPEQPFHDELITLDDLTEKNAQLAEKNAQSKSLGQTFVPFYDGLQAIALYLEPGSPGEGTLSLQIQTSPQDSTQLRSTWLPLTEITSPGYYRFPFPPLEDSKGKDYFLLISIQGSGSVRVGSANGEAYLNGSLYLVGDPPLEPTSQDAQLSFSLEYHTGQLIFGLIKEGLTWLGWLVVSLFLFVIPGWALLNLLWPDWTHMGWGEKLGLASGVSLAIYPILLLWTNLAGLQLGPLYAWLPPMLGSVYLLARTLPKALVLREGFRSAKQYQAIKREGFQVKSVTWFNFALLVTLLLVFATRFWAIRRLDLPMWGDSYQHSVISQLIVDHDGLFQSWQPYAEMVTFTYHYGFHSLVAVLHWITHYGNLPIQVPQATMWTGQIVNGLAVIGLFPLAMRMRFKPLTEKNTQLTEKNTQLTEKNAQLTEKNAQLTEKNAQWGGLAAVLLAGVLVPMPMFYVNWGRYTQLAGQAILPAAIYLLWAALESDRLDWRQHTLSGIALGGLALTHYRVLVFAAGFYLAHFLLSLRSEPIKVQIRNIFWSGIGAALIILPWFIHVFAGRTMLILYRQLTTAPAQLPSSSQYNAIGNLFVFLPPLIWLSLPVLITWGMWRRERSLALISLWWFIIFLLTNPQWLNLPGARAITNFTVFIAAYIPAGLILGEATGWVVDRLHVAPVSKPEQENSGLSWQAKAMLFLLATGLGVWGARQRLSDMHIAEHALATRPDLRAASWIQQNLPSDSRFLVNSFFAYDGQSIVGSDGGWWLPLIAHRSTTLPPLNYVAEQGPRSDYISWINHLTAEINLKGIDHPDMLQMLKERGVTHVYIGQRQGSINSGGNFIDPQQLLASPNYRPIYHQDRVWVFQLIP